MSDVEWAARLALCQPVVERLQATGAGRHVALDEANQVVGLADEPLAPHDDVLCMGRKDLVGRLGGDLPHLADVVVEVEMLVEGHVGGDEAYGAAVLADPANARPTAHARPGHNRDDHQLLLQEETTDYTDFTDIYPRIGQIRQIFKTLLLICLICG